MTTSPDKWETVKELFEAALEEETTRRSSFLQERCSDEGVRAEVERLLAEHEQAGTFLSTPALDNFAAGNDSIPTSQRLAEGVVLAGRFRIIRFIASGGMGEVYEAEDKELRERVAVKTIRPEILTQPNAIARFRREVHLARQVTHPNVCRIFDLFRHKPAEGPGQDVVFISMELLHGNHLGKTLEDRGPMEPDEALPLIRQMSSALAAAHAVGIVHRDFKPQNVVLVPVPGQRQQRAVVTDFGLALQSESSAESVSLTTGQGLLGTPAYMSPEQLEGRAAKPASDIYALGLVIYEMVTGKRPFKGDSPISAAMKRLSEAPTPPRKFKAAISPLWESVILRCLERDPAKRLANAEDVAHSLAGEGKTVSQFRTRPKRGNRSVAVFSAALLTAAVGLTYAVRHWHRPGDTATKANARRSVAVLGFKNLSGKSDVGWLATTLSEMLTTELAAGENLRTIPGENVSRMKRDLGLPDTDSLATDTLAEIHTNLGSDLVVLGSYLDLGGQVRVDLHLQDAAQGETIASFSETGSEVQLLDLINRVGAELRGKCGLAGITQSQAAEVKASSPISPQATRLYAEGLAKLRVFDVLAARDRLQQAVTSDPSFALAHSALAEAWSRLGYSEKAIQEAGKAVDASTNLSREEQLSIQGQYRAAKKEWTRAAEIYGELFGSFPDNIDYGLRLAAAQTSAGKSQDALSTLTALRRLALPVGADPRIDLAEASAGDTLGDYKRELEAARRAAEKGDATGGRFVVARALKFEGAALRALGETKPAMAALEQASSLSIALGDRGSVPLITIGNILAEQGDFDRAQETFERALRSAREIGDRATECFALTNIAHVHGDRGDLAAAKPLYIQALGVQREIEDRRNAGSTLSNLGHLLYQIGDYSEGEKTLDEALAIAREVGNRRSEAYVLGFIGELRYAEGKLAESKAHSEESLTIAREIGHKRVVESSLSDIGTVLLAQGNFIGAQKYQEDALAVAKDIGEKGSAAQYTLALAQISLEKGLPTEAEALAREPLAEFQAEKAKGGEALAQTTLAQALLAQNKVASARKAMDLAAVAATHIQYHLIRFTVELTKALVVADSGQTAAAETLLRAAISRTARVGCVLCEFEARLALGQAQMKRASRSTAARRDLEQLEKDATAKGLLLIARKAAVSWKTVN